MSDEFELRHSPPVYSRPVKPTMDERASAAWNDWATALVRNEIRAHEKVLAEKIKGLEEEIGQLRADQMIERAHRVIDLPNWRKRA
jgi:hypothetical protein